MLSKEFTLLITIAFLIAAPIAWYFMHQWLQQYTFRIPIGIWFFLATIFCSLFIAWITVPIGRFVHYLASSPKLERVRFRAVAVSIALAVLIVGVLQFVALPSHFRAPSSPSSMDQRR